MPTPTNTPIPTATTAPTATPAPTQTATVLIQLLQPWQTVRVGDIMVFTLRLSSGSQIVDGLGIYINFDASRLRVVDSSGNPVSAVENPGTPFNITLQNHADNIAGEIDYSVGSLMDPKPSGTYDFGTFRLKALSTTDDAGVDLTFSFDAARNRSTDAAFEGRSVLGGAQNARGATIFILPAGG